MIHPHLQSKNITVTGASFAVLLEPAVNIRSDLELDAAVTWHGRAVIVPFLDWTWEILPPVTLSPSEFRETWRGD